MRIRVRVRTAIVLAAVVASFSVLPMAPSAALTNEHFGGPFVSKAVLPPRCKSPVLLCTDGQLFDSQGTVVATYYFTIDTLVPANLAKLTFNYTGHSVITKVAGQGRQGTIIGSDHGQLKLTATLKLPFVTTITVVGGTGDYVGATGQFVAPGTLNLVGATAVGSYSGDVTTP